MSPMKMTRHSVQLGKDTVNNYRAGTLRSSSNEEQPAATQANVVALQQGQVQPRSMTAEDFNGDGMQDPSSDTAPLPEAC